MEYNFIGQLEWPTNVVMPAAAQQFAEWSIGLLVAAFVLWGIRNLIVRRDAALLIRMIGGGVACVMEPHLMRMFKFFYPEVGQHVFWWDSTIRFPISYRFRTAHFSGRRLTCS